ncbi:glycosyltransferase family 2 protein [Homoserinibacter sp. GY 40078]|uniref:glycosyltransferase family 2 protein n=1 Tax=Homoserinibacter sp. GY 40078 TaxID=2603275 RepID=UPI0011C79F0B|nr:glycosyltransferase [Homoserinibacter sp. GY 40078]TXK17758.1 glycosyltransferase family 2 protein [Homoserinibacter sp. GY 40078]
MDATTIVIVAISALTVYYVVYHLGYLVIIGSAAHRMAADLAWPAEIDHAEIFANPLTPRVSVLVPAHNEEAGIVDSVESLRNLRYPDVQIVVIDDGSTDATFPLLEQRYALRPVQLDMVSPEIPQEGATRGTYRSDDGSVIVIRKESTGRRADAVNAGLRISSGELVCMIDADSVLAPDALLRLAAPFVDDQRVIAAGGSVLPSNGVTIDGGQVTRFDLPRTWIERFQVVEYLRAFLIGRSGWAQVNGLVVISGAFGLYRRDAILRIGGLATTSLAEDADLLMAVHVDAVNRGIPYRVIFSAEPVCWTEVPRRVRVLGRQRTRWAHGLGEILADYRKVIARPRFGALGMLSMPWTMAFEYLAPVVAVVGTVLTVAALALGLIPISFALLVAAAGLGLSTLVTITALAVEAAWFRRYGGARRLLVLLAAAFAEPFFYRPLVFAWQLRGMWRAHRGAVAEWGEMEHTGSAPATQGAVLS